MAAIRMVPLMFISLIQLRKSLKMRYQLINAQNYRILKIKTFINSFVKPKYS